MRHVFHVLISILMWCLFGYYWYVVSGREIGDDTIQALGVLTVVIILGLTFTLWWVAHNKRLARRNRRSAAPPAVPEKFDTDYLLRPIVAPDIKVLQAASVIDIHLEPFSEAEAEANPDHEYPGKKVYSVANPTAGEVR